MNNQNMDSIVKELVRECGVPVHLKGYTYLTEAISAAAKSDVGLCMDALYQQIASNNETTACRVNRAMRHSIEIACFRENASFDSKSNEEFIAFYAQKAKSMLS